MMEIIDQASMVNSKPCTTLVDTSSNLSGDPGDSVNDPTHYRTLADALRYMIFTRPDISYFVQQVCLHMHDPREPHMTALKRILLYLQGTLDFSLLRRGSSTSELVVYSDVDWAGCPGTHWSTSGYAVFLGDNLISRSSKR
jgi:hypothetical protein